MELDRDEASAVTGGDQPEAGELHRIDLRGPATREPDRLRDTGGVGNIRAGHAEWESNHEANAEASNTANLRRPPEHELPDRHVCLRHPQTQIAWTTTQPSEIQAVRSS